MSVKVEFRITNRDSNNTAHAAEIILEWYQ